MSEVSPLFGILHHLAAACGIVVIDRYLLADVFFGDSESFFHAELHRKSVGVPAGLALHLIALHRFEAAGDVLDGAGHDMVYARHAVGRRWTFEEYERRAAFALGHAGLEETVAVPDGKYLLIYV